MWEQDPSIVGSCSALLDMALSSFARTSAIRTDRRVEWSNLPPDRTLAPFPGRGSGPLAEDEREAEREDDHTLGAVHDDADQGAAVALGGIGDDERVERGRPG